MGCIRLSAVLFIGAVLCYVKAEPSKFVQLRPYMRALRRLYNPLTMRHRMHSDLDVIHGYENLGYHLENGRAHGRVIPWDIFQAHYRRLKRICPQLIKVESVEHPTVGNQILTFTDVSPQMRAGGFVPSRKPIGGCTWMPACGATKPLYRLNMKALKGYGDYMYTVDTAELRQKNRHDPLYKETAIYNTVCYVW